MNDDKKPDVELLELLDIMLFMINKLTNVLEIKDMKRASEKATGLLELIIKREIK